MPTHQVCDCVGRGAGADGHAHGRRRHVGRNQDGCVRAGDGTVIIIRWHHQVTVGVRAGVHGSGRGAGGVKRKFTRAAHITWVAAGHPRDRERAAHLPANDPEDADDELHPAWVQLRLPLQPRLQLQPPRSRGGGGGGAPPTDGPECAGGAAGVQVWLQVAGQGTDGAATHPPMNQSMQMAQLGCRPTIQKVKRAKKVGGTTRMGSTSKSTTAVKYAAGGGGR